MAQPIQRIIEKRVDPIAFVNLYYSCGKTFHVPLLKGTILRWMMISSASGHWIEWKFNSMLTTHWSSICSNYCCTKMLREGNLKEKKYRHKKNKSTSNFVFPNRQKRSKGVGSAENFGKSPHPVETDLFYYFYNRSVNVNKSMEIWSQNVRV